MELIIRGYPSRIRAADWQKANSLPEKELPRLTEKQRERTRTLRIPEHAYAIALKAGELAKEHASKKVERVARLIVDAVKKRDPAIEVTAVVWDFVEYQFKFLTRVNGRENYDSIPTEIIDDVLLEKEGAEERLKKQVDYLLGGWAE